jgi:tryptophan-rich sensory protein
LAVAPTLTVLAVFALVEALSRQRLLFASLAASAFLIYLDPQHGTNSTRTLVFSQMLAAGLGLCLYLAIGPGYLSGGLAMVGILLLMVGMTTLLVLLQRIAVRLLARYTG